MFQHVFRYMWVWYYYHVHQLQFSGLIGHSKIYWTLPMCKDLSCLMWQCFETDFRPFNIVPKPNSRTSPSTPNPVPQYTLPIFFFCSAAKKSQSIYFFFPLHIWILTKTQGILSEGNLDHPCSPSISLWFRILYCLLYYVNLTDNLPRDKKRAMKGSELPSHPLRYIVILLYIKTMALLSSPLKILNGLKQLLDHNRITILALSAKINIPLI